MKAYSYEELLKNESSYMFSVNSPGENLSKLDVDDCYDKLSDAIEAYSDYYASDDYFVIPEKLAINVFERRSLYDLLDTENCFDEILTFMGSYQNECDPYFATEEVEALGESFKKMFNCWKAPLKNKYFCGRHLGYLAMEHEI